MILPLLSALFFIFFLTLHHTSHAQQIYSNNGLPYCYGHTSTSTLGYSCNGPQTSCSSYLIFMSNPTHQTPEEISHLLNSDPSKIAQINTPPPTQNYPPGQEIIVPVHCSCSGQFYQHNTTYTIRPGDIYFHLANITFQDLTTCQALIDQNAYVPENLPPGGTILVPLRCACPTRNQIISGVRYLLTYVIAHGDNVSSIALRFNVSAQLVLDANPLWDGTLYSYSTLLVPLKYEPGMAETVPSPPRIVSPEASTFTTAKGGSNNKWLFIGIGIAIGFLAPGGLLLLWLLHHNRARIHLRNPIQGDSSIDDTTESDELSDMSLGTSISRIESRIGDLERGNQDSR